MNGTRVQDSKGNFGTVEGEPVLTASGEIVTVVMDDKTLSPSGRSDYLVSDLRREDYRPASAKPSDGLNGGLYKAEAFAEYAQARGWSALARTGNQYGLALVTATKGDTTIVIKFYEGRFSYEGSAVQTTGAKREVLRSRKIRNVSAARKMIAG